MEKLYFTSESVTEGHPDKICDKISDSVLDALLEKDKNARCACEVCVTTGLVVVMGEITTHTYVDIEKIAREAIREIGYTNNSYGFDSDNCAVINLIHEQSPDIALGVDKSREAKNGEKDARLNTGAGDQGMVFGYASNETPELMPLAISLSHALAKKLAAVRKDGTLKYLRPDGKTQVTVEYENGTPKRIDAIVVSAQHAPNVSQDKIREDIISNVILPTIPAQYIDENTRYFINGTGRFVVGGPKGDSGLTGRKIIVDTYGGASRHGGGAFSGKDPTKVDRSGAYMARYAAKNVVKAGLADKCEIQVSYVIGVATPVSILVDTFGTARIPEAKIEELVRECFDFRPAAIIENFDLRRPIYKNLAAYGHMGREDLLAPWESTEISSVLREKAGL